MQRACARRMATSRRRLAWMSKPALSAAEMSEKNVGGLLLSFHGFTGDSLGQLQQRLLQLRVLDPGVGPNQPQRSRIVHETKDVRGLGSRLVRYRIEICDRSLEDLGDALQSAGAHAISALFVFLHLLECQVELRGEIGLRHILARRRARMRRPTSISCGSQLLLFIVSLSSPPRLLVGRGAKML